MYRDSDPRCREAPRCIGTYATEAGAERARAQATPPGNVKPEYFHTWVESREDVVLPC